MKIIQVIPAFSIGGAETMCENLTYALTRQGHNVTVVSLYEYHSAITERLEAAGIDVRYLGKSRGIDLKMYPALSRLMDELRPDAIHSHLYAAKYVFPVAARKGIRAIHTIHTVAEKESKKSDRFLNKLFYKRHTAVPVALSSLVRESVMREYQLPQAEVPVVLNGIDLSNCIPKRDYEREKPFRILHIGRFTEPKNHRGLLDAFQLFHSRRSDTELWLVGDGPLKAEMETLAANYGLADCVRFWGLQSDVYGFLHDADLFTLPSNYEGIPMTLIEAMGTGLPIVATAVGGVPDMIQNRDNGILVTNDRESIAGAFEAYYDRQALRQQMGEHALRSAVAFSAEEMARHYVQIYCGEQQNG